MEHKRELGLEKPPGTGGARSEGGLSDLRLLFFFFLEPGLFLEEEEGGAEVRFSEAGGFLADIGPGAAGPPFVLGGFLGPGLPRSGWKLGQPSMGQPGMLQIAT